MSTPTEIARWMREEHDRVDRLVDRLAERTGAVPRTNLEGWLQALTDEFEEFRARMEKHFALEEEGGYLSGVSEARPYMQDDIDRLILEHRELSRLMTAIFDQISSLHATTPLHIQDACCRIRNLIGMIANHEDHENLLVSHAFSRDVGSLD